MDVGKEKYLKSVLDKIKYFKDSFRKIIKKRKFLSNVT
jgi:hypothetical protein